MMPWPKLQPSWLPPGTRVGPWKVTAFHGRGAFGAVFRAVLAGRDHGGFVALKLAYSPSDPRFQREAELLSRVQHPSVPRLLGRGTWQHPGGAAYPFLVMEWVEGVPLYEWAARLNPSSREVFRVLAQAARALEATHAAGAVHRDVKGANILVSPTGDRAFLTDYGAGNYSGAEPLTKDGLPPGTENYRSPEAWDFELHRPRNTPSAYKAQPADDVFALGVSAYRCVTGTYLPAFEVREEETGPGSLVWPVPSAPRELNPRVTPELSALILRMLSERPEERPTPGELAEALKQAASRPAPGVDQCLFDTPPRAPARTVWTLARARVPAWLAACAVLVGALSAVAIGSALRTERNSAASEIPVGVGDSSLTSPETPQEESSGPKSIKDSKLPKPVKGQRRAPHCQPPAEVTINGGCWIELPSLKPPCGDLGYEWQGRCYVPNYPLPREREPTSGPGQ